MDRRSLLTGALSLAATPLAAMRAPSPTPAAIPLQTSPLAGFQFHAGEDLWPQLAVGQALQLAREPNNPYDANAVRVDWRGRQLGYIARDDNTAVAQLLDRGERVSARIEALASSRNPWERVRLAISLERA